MFVKIREENITMLTFLIVCPAVFLAGLIDAIGGGGANLSVGRIASSQSNCYK